MLQNIRTLLEDADLTGEEMRQFAARYEADMAQTGSPLPLGVAVQRFLTGSL